MVLLIIIPVRREHPVVQELVHVVGRSVKLYNAVLHFLRTLFANTGNQRLCSLRTDVLMALHDAGVAEVCPTEVLSSALKIRELIRTFQDLLD